MSLLQDEINLKIIKNNGINPNIISKKTLIILIFLHIVSIFFLFNYQLFKNINLLQSIDKYDIFLFIGYLFYFWFSFGFILEFLLKNPLNKNIVEYYYSNFLKSKTNDKDFDSFFYNYLLKNQLYQENNIYNIPKILFIRKFYFLSKTLKIVIITVLFLTITLFSLDNIYLSFGKVIYLIIFYLISYLMFIDIGSRKVVRGKYNSESTYSEIDAVGLLFIYLIIFITFN